MSQTPQRNELTICCVSYRNAQHLELNWEITKRLNSDCDYIHWVIADNTPEDSPCKDKLIDDNRFTLIPGVAPQPKASDHHTMALAKALGAVHTRFVLVLDPDFYIIRRDWVDLLINYMRSNSLSFMGTTWNPKYAEKYRYFPTLHCFLADTTRISIEELDFRPIGMGAPFDRTHANNSEYETRSVSTKWGRFLSRFPVMHNRIRIHYDTGGRLYYKYAASKEHSYHCLTPVFREAAEGFHRLSWRARMIESLLPDELCRLPKNKKSYRNTGFSEQGLWPSVPSQWDEFYWNDQPFGFHVRRNAQKGERDESAEIELLKNRLQMIIPS